MFCFSEQLFVLMLAHLLFAPLDNASHRLTSFSMNYAWFMIIRHAA